MMKKLAIKTPQSLLGIINIMALILFLFYGDKMEKDIIISIIVFIAIIYVSNYVLSKVSKGDNYIFLITSMLISIGIIMIYRINPSLGIKQIVLFGVGIVSFFGTYFVLKKIKNLNKYTIVYLGVSLFLYLVTLIFGTSIGGAKNWINIGGFGLQPSEIVKILFVFFIASYYTRRDEYKKIFKKKTNVVFMAVSYVFIGFLFLQKELGTALLMFLVFNVLFYVYEEDRKLINLNLIGAVVMGAVSYLLFNHVRLRVDIWIDPWKEVASKGYQITQSLFAVGAGGFFGTGIGLGYPEFIPEVHTDFIFSAICEEMGVFAGIAVILLFMIMVYRGMKITLEQPNMFYRILAFGITSMIGFQAFIILGGVINMIPLTGITLPFVSYGGSSLISSFISLAILQVASEELDIEEEDDDYEPRVQKNN